MCAQRRLPFLYLIAGSVVLASAAAHAQVVLYVDDDASTNGDGAAWISAYKYLQDALAEASTNGVATEIRVAQGTYKPDQDERGLVTPGERTETFQLLNDVVVKGGYRGCPGGNCGGGDPDDRYIQTYESILSGDLGSNDGPNFANNVENSYHVTAGDGTDPTAVLDGFTITAGNANGPAIPHDAGGGMRNAWGSPTVVNCTFTENYAIWGAGMENIADSNPAVSDCTFVNNVADIGCGMNVNGASPVLTRCVFSENSATADGGGMNIFSDSNPVLLGCTFSGNTATGGGGIANWNSDPLLIDCSFMGNSASADGGGLFTVENSSPTLVNCVFSGNSAGAENVGGGIYNSSTGGAIVTNCTFSANTAEVGGGICNVATQDLTLANCILWGNTHTAPGRTMEEAQFYGGGDITVNYTCVQGWSRSWGGRGNLGDDPLFVDADGVDDIAGTPDDNLHLQAGSPCINAGSIYTPQLPAEDLDGNPRIQECRPDMGVYESSLQTSALDCNTNGTADDCDVYEGTSQDCNQNHTPDECEADEDCNTNGIQDLCDIAGGTSTDCNQNGTPDECEVWGATLLVDADAPGANDGSNWTDAFTELRVALATAACASGTVTEIRVAEGTYTPAPPSGTRAATFELINNLTLYGGYAGYGQPDPDERNADLHPTILSGDLDGNDGPNFANNEDNALHVVTSDSTDATAVLNGFTIRAGNAGWTGYPYSGIGSGVSLRHASPTLTDCTITSNWAIDGGGMYNHNGSPALTDCTFAGNSAEGSGGGMYSITDAHPTLIACAFIDNHAGDEGGVGGGGMVNVNNSNPTLIDCAFISNSGRYGAAVDNVESDPHLVNCKFIGNSGFHGGGIYNVDSSPVLANCMFSSNSAYRGGAMRCNHYSYPSLTNCTFGFNSATNVGGGIHADVSCGLAVTNCVLWGNTDAGALDQSAQIHHSDTWLNIDYSCVQGWTGSWGGTGNTGGDPMLADPAGLDNVPGTEDDDLRVAAGSAAIDAGDNDAVPQDTYDLDDDLNTVEPIPYDLDSISRFVDDPTVEPDPGDPGSLGPPVVDMGAYEYQADCNTNGVIDSLDIDAGTSEDCNINGIPDECEPDEDCNTNGVQDICDIAAGTSADCNANVVPDECDIAGGTSQDCNTNDVPDECEPDEDCNTNGVQDICDLAAGTSTDCNANVVPDECDIDAGTSTDCNTNSMPDECDLAGATSADCNINNFPDECDIAQGASDDCQPNEVPDECDIDLGASDDLNTNRVPDECELAAVESAHSCRNHGPAGELCLDIGIGGSSRFTGDNVEPRMGGTRKLEFETDLVVWSFTASVACNNKAYAGAITETAYGNTTVTVEFDPALPNNDCCTVTLSGDDLDDQWSVANLLGDADRNLDTNSFGLLERKAAARPGSERDNGTVRCEL